MIFLKTPNTNKSVSKTAFKTKVTGIENKISSISCLVATATVNKKLERLKIKYLILLIWLSKGMLMQKLQELFNLLIHQIHLAQKLTFIKNAEIRAKFKGSVFKTR